MGGFSQTFLHFLNSPFYVISNCIWHEHMTPAPSFGHFHVQDQLLGGGGRSRSRRSVFFTIFCKTLFHGLSSGIWHDHIKWTPIFGHFRRGKKRVGWVKMFNTLLLVGNYRIPHKLWRRMLKWIGQKIKQMDWRTLSSSTKVETVSFTAGSP